MADGVTERDRVQSVAHRVVVSSQEIGELVAERTHGYTSTEMRQALDAWLDVWAGRVTAHVVTRESIARGGDVPAEREVHGQWTVVRRRLAARSSANRVVFHRRIEVDCGHFAGYVI